MSPPGQQDYAAAAVENDLMLMRSNYLTSLKTAIWSLAGAGVLSLSLGSGAAMAQAEEPAAPATDDDATPDAREATEAPAAKPAVTPEEREQARESYAAGEAAFRRGEFSAAAKQFGKAEAAIPSPHAKYWLAMSLDEAGELGPALVAYESFLDDPNRERAGEGKVQTAESRLAELQKTPGTVTFTVEPKDALITVDGAPVKVNEPLTLETGKHDVQIESEGFLNENTEIDVKPGANSTHAIVLKVNQLPSPVPPPAVQEKNNVAAYITLGIAAGGIAVGTIFGIKALNAKSDYDRTPSESLADDVERDALISDMSFAAAVTLGITGIVLLTSDDSGAEDGTHASGARGRRVIVAPYATPTGGGAAAHVTF